MKIKIVKYVLAGLAFLAAFFAWFSVDQAINVAGASVWIAPIIYFSLLFVFLYLEITLIGRAMILQTMIVAIFFLSFIFAQNWWHLAAIFLAGLFAFWSLARIENDFRLNVKLSVWKSISAGSTMMIFAFSIVIASQYYFEIRNADSAHLMPQLKISSQAGGITAKILAMLNPSMKNLDREGLTVDQLIAETQKKQSEADLNDMDKQIDQAIESSNPNATLQQKQAMRDQVRTQLLKKTNSTTTEEQNNLMLVEGRKYFSDIAGRQLTGSEKVSDVLAETVNRKINQYLGSGLSDTERSSPLPYILAIGLFLTVFPLGTLANTLWMILVNMIMWIFIKSKLIRIAKIPVEMDVIE